MRRPFLTMMLVSLLAGHMDAAEKTFVSQTISLEDRTPDDVAVLGGTINHRPERTSYGYAAIADEKMVYAFTEDGRLIWSRSSFSRLKPFMLVGAEDMIYTVTKNSTVSMMNASGLVIWKQEAGFDVTEAPVQGSDGRIFVRGSGNIACYSVNGVCRWMSETEAQDTRLPLVQLDDGSLLCILARTENGKSVGKRLDIFGAEQEEIVFAGKITELKSTHEGVVIAFSDGGIGMCSVRDNLSYSRWSIPAHSGAFSQPIKFLDDCGTGRIAVACGTPARITYMSARTGEEDGETFSTRFQNIQTASFMGHTSQGLVLADRSGASCYGSDGQTVWQCRFNPSKKWNFVYPTDSGTLHFCMSNWAMETYIMRQGGDGNRIRTERRLSSYRDFSGNRTVISTGTSGEAISGKLLEDMRRGFREGNLGENEKEWMSVLTNEFNQLYEDWTQGGSIQSLTNERDFYRRNLTYTGTVLELAAECGVAGFTHKISSLMKTVEDKSMLSLLMRVAGKTGFDPEGHLIDGIEHIVRHRAAPSDFPLLDEAISSTYRICRFMGRPVFMQKGKLILTYMLYPQFDQSTKKKAQLYLKKIAASKL